MTLDELTQRISADRAPAVELRAVELSLYIPFTIEDEQRTPLQDRRGDSLAYPSRYAALKALATTGLRAVEVVHISAYDEMVGVDSVPGQSEMREPVNLDRFV